MRFNDAMAQLQRARPGVPIGRTAEQGQYFEQARHMDFRRHDDLNYVAEGRSGKRMWLYVSEKKGRICCGNKDY